MNSSAFEGLSPFEKTVLLELARCQALASAAFQASYHLTDGKAPPPGEILKKAFDTAIAGITETLKNSRG